MSCGSSAPPANGLGRKPGVTHFVVGAASAAIPRQRASPWQAPIAAEAAPTLCSPITPPQCPEEPAGTTLGAGSRRRGRRVEKARRGSARDGRPFPLRQEVESETSTRSPTRPEGQKINGRSSRPFLGGSPQAWPRGWYPPALATSPHDEQKRGRRRARQNLCKRTKKAPFPG